MADREPQNEPEEKRAPNWDYSQHPLKSGGMTILVFVLGWTLCMLILGGFVLWLWLR